MVVSAVGLFVWRALSVKLQTERSLPLGFQIGLDTSQQHLVLNLILLLLPSGNELIRLFKTFLLKVG